MELELIQTLKGHKKPINDLAWDPDGLTLASAAEDCLVILWDPLSGKSCQVLDQHQAGVLYLNWSPCKKYLASGDRDSVVCVRDYIDNSCWKVQLQGGSIMKLTWLLERQLLASYVTDRSIRIWSVPAKSEVRRIALDEDMRDFIWITEGILLVSLDDKALLCYMDKDSKNVLLYPMESQELISGNYRMPNGSLIPNPSSSYLDFCNRGTKEKITSMITNNKSIQSIFPSLKHPLVATSSLDGSLSLIQTETLEKKTISGLSTDPPAGRQFAFHPKWPVFAVLNEDRKLIQIWKINY